ncbi:SIR2 family NAD-dependent protein deacylase [Bradyrhizobium sp. Arg314]
MNPIPRHLLITRDSHAEARLDLIKGALTADVIVPYLGPGLLRLGCPTPAVPDTPEAVAAALNERASAPSKIRTNMWSVAQFIEQRRHRRTLQGWMAEIFAVPAPPTILHAWLATLPLSLIVDSWYDGAMRAALVATGRTDVVEIQGVPRANEIRDIWTKAYDLSGIEIDPVPPVETVLYVPHGSIRPAANFLVSDSDYVEVLTDIDIQTPIPEQVKQRRNNRGFFFVGCRFDDQMLRTYARQIMKRSDGPHFALIDGTEMTKNERRFLTECAVTVIDMPIREAAARLAGSILSPGGQHD